MQFFAYFVKDIVGIVRIRIGNIVLGILILPRGDLPGGSAVSIGLIGIILLEDQIAVVFNVPGGQTAVAVIAEHLACHAVTDLGEPVILIVGVGVDMGAAVTGLLHGDKVILVIIGVSDLVVAGGAHLCLPHQAPGEIVIIRNDPLCAAIGNEAGL